MCVCVCVYLYYDLVLFIEHTSAIKEPGVLFIACAIPIKAHRQLKHKASLAESCSRPKGTKPRLLAAALPCYGGAFSNEVLSRKRETSVHGGHCDAERWRRKVGKNCGSGSVVRLLVWICCSL